MKSIRQWYQDQHFRTKLIVSYLLLSVIPLLLLFSFSIQLSNRILVRSAQKNAEMIIDRTQEDLNSLFKEYISFLATISENAIIQEALQETFFLDNEQYHQKIESGRELLNIFKYRKDLYGIAVLGENGQNIIDSQKPLRSHDYRKTYWYREALQRAFSPNYLPLHMGSYLFDDDTENFITITTPVEDATSTARLGIVVLELREQVVKDLLGNRLGDFGYLFVQYSRSGFTSSDERIPDSNYLVRLANMREIEEKLLNQNKELVLIRDLELSGVKLAAVISLEELTRESKQLGMVLLILISGTILVATITASVLSKNIARPVQELSAVMRQVETGDLSARIENLPSDEFGALGISFNQMVTRIQRLLVEMHEEEVKLRKSELRALQAQVNPHFLYNTLDSINWLAREKRNEDVLKLVSALTTLFRIGISKGHDFISMQEELDHVKSYLTIQKVRFADSFTYEFDIDPKVLAIPVIKLILQPVVENALYHGIKRSGGKGNIQIRARKIHDKMIIEISDNGKGMTATRLLEVKAELSGSVEKKESTVYGLKNVHDRIQIYYGEAYGLTIHSEEDEGTVVMYKIPIREDV